MTALMPNVREISRTKRLTILLFFVIGLLGILSIANSAKMLGSLSISVTNASVGLSISYPPRISFAMASGVMPFKSLTSLFAPFTNSYLITLKSYFFTAL